MENAAHQHKTGMFSAIFGASLLGMISISLIIISVISLASKQDESPSAWIMLMCGMINLSVDVTCLVFFNSTESFESLIPWLLKFDDYKLKNYELVVGHETYGSIEDVCDEKETKKESCQHQVSSALNLGGSLIHLLADTARSIIIVFVALCIIIFGTDDGTTDFVGSIFVNIVTICIAIQIAFVAFSDEIKQSETIEDCTQISY
eukprot:CAMPEP_0196583092 /NCGR_PEP_ID=MMETSP1081-20130531/41962_1 /TAXON_ID=36882 /ORGANISM="Pyramimonas amylifera, Strain CCMP720" /LENGTH=204 /DNA_ID=CAMNT_0041903861 /DNA_START=748 /DNA_END=1362 /DNA_ORIENTATION=-